ncbi:MAG: hypothetical protein A2X42_02405 [Candidatus Margulisbacteria bacterium GWF2_38_17]|nr:MAG: hypothetical protein A2X43_09360 [Candidatus Margulisbacteria bacterium GWD2_39_127]OGI02902.1 MAG: hypothetical protein A2X42_02405 [Candidatus Margulisbacteria bacterium GWF2_38_17]OGI06802.1 MAG: hypothetical protein A2X41_03575 [Candidatus Margulisbacteria bacterium GWE2_39_32]
MKNLNQEEIKNLLPHRYENLLIDEEDIYEEEAIKKGVLKLTVNKNDSLKRDVFFKETKDNKVFIEPVYMEILALGSIVSMGTLPEGITAFFSAITNYKKNGDIKEGQLLIGEVEKGKAKGDFHRFSGVIKNENNDLIAEGDLMAFAMNASLGVADSDKKQIEIPNKTMEEIVQKNHFSWKSSSMVFVDKIVNYNEEGTIVTEYTYPQDHVFTQGHFPGNPVMMGISQWIAGADALWLYASKQLAAGNIAGTSVTLSADIDIVKSDGTVTAELKNCVCSAPIIGNVLGEMSVTSTKKLYFRDIVKPNDSLVIIAKNILIQ